MKPTLVVLAAGMSNRYGRLKQLEPMGPAGETLLDYGIYDALRAGFSGVALVIRRELEPEFRGHLSRRWPHLHVHLAYQEMTRVPAGGPPTAARVKPWGTAHAVLAVEGAMDGPFAVSNADDFYGAGAYAALAAHLGTIDPAAPEQALVGYPLRRTLSSHGGVSRGLCETDAHGLLRRVVEMLEVRAAGDQIVGERVDGTACTLAPDGIASMNLWGFTPAIFPLLRERFTAFLRERGGDARAEFLIPTAVNDLVASARMRVRVLPTDEAWMGVTYPEDRPGVVTRLAALVADGRYPQPLSAPSAEPEPR
jgi:hypothetical protein